MFVVCPLRIIILFSSFIHLFIYLFIYLFFFFFFIFFFWGGGGVGTWAELELFSDLVFAEEFFF